MAWREKISQGSFRGVPFQTLETETETGRRVAIHEYAGRDTPYAEDMGKRGRQFSFECFVSGEDYMQQRDALIAAFEQAGAGKLVHKFIGELTVQVITVRVRESNRELGMARFAVTVVESGKNEFPSNSVSTATVLNNRANVATTALQSNFSQSFNVSGLPQFVADEANTVISGGFSQMSNMPSFSGNVAGANISQLMHSPEKLASVVTDAVSLIDDVNDLRTMRDFGGDLPAVAKTTATRAAQAANQESLLQLFNVSSVIEMSRRMAEV